MPLREPSRWSTLILALVGGVLTWAAFPDVGWWGTAYLGVATLFLAMRRDSAWWNALVGLVWGVTFFAPHITWADFAVGRAPWLALAVVEACYVALLGAAWAWARRGNAVWRSAGLQLVVFVILWVAMEELRSAWPFGGFPWGRLAFSQSSSPLLAFASIAGAPLVTAVVVAVGVLLAQSWTAARSGAIGVAGLRGVVAVVLVAAGALIPLDSRAQTGELRVGAVQGNVPTPGLEAFAQRREVLDNHIAGTHALLERVEPGQLDLVVWPENGTDIDPQVDAEAAALIDDAARAVDAPILVGTVEYPPTGGRYNTAVLWEPGVGVVAEYSKQHPAPFAEYIPMREFFRTFSPAVDLVTTDMVAGTEVGVVPVESPRLDRTVLVGDVICFEVAYDSLVRDAVRAGAEVIVVQTNNASFGYTAESTQQLAMSRLRAVELGRATVQISTVGVSAVIAPNGAVTQQTGLFTADQLIATLPLRDSLTPAARLGGWPAWIADALAVCVVVTGMAGARRIRRDDRPEGAR
ncbi:apolipoprotein N-acyltransferase [Cellulomonas chengniuliangii]|uniref:Apolipoprotein N-acyltransferase n=1 Tax=Cellulomonas chengniuliangii TaxID=2968084 RepID=A0ABY5L2H7_9CELL|nr:apolipoprotein N-acyltransferase [Cellulomonas chengniuliangii]MCC2308476.1 apolipoprotein N-acyltransferase [Cellulomonas chengniuliangii]UUI76849.1 apolipoprotein N-acyltransferase [Cellulomonas chengniuliangii]